jgi:hypothetical protein
MQEAKFREAMGTVAAKLLPKVKEARDKNAAAGKDKDKESPLRPAKKSSPVSPHLQSLIEFGHNAFADVRFKTGRVFDGLELALPCCLMSNAIELLSLQLIAKWFMLRRFMHTGNKQKRNNKFKTKPRSHC